MFNMKRKLTCKVIYTLTTTFKPFLVNMQWMKMLVWNHKLTLCDVDFLVANAFKIDIKSYKDNFIFEL